MADVFVGPIITKLADIGLEYLKDQIRWQTGMKDELKSLEKNLPQIQSVVRYASAVEHIKEKNLALNEWLWQLRDAIDDANDVMEELEYLKLEKQLTKTEKPRSVMRSFRRKVRSVMRSMKKKIVQIGLRALKIDPTLKRLEEVVHKLDEVSARFASFLHLVDKAEQELQDQQLKLNKARETGSSYTDDFIGRVDKKKYVMEWLKKTSNDKIALLSVVGQGGMGKTTLLQDIYKKEEMKNYFDLKIWVCVSNYFNVTKVIADMLESLKNQRLPLESLDVLQKNLESEVKTKKFLLVLDDIWEEENEEQNKSKWEKVLAPLASGKLGSKILVTTRMGSVSVMLSKIIHKKVEKLTLEGLDVKECLQVLKKHAFNEGDEPADYPKLMLIAEKIVKKLSGSPLAAKVIGGFLNSHLDETHWNKVLNYKIGSQTPILDILKLSYISLPKLLQSCFSFCCIFPQDYEFDKDDLIQMWIALGFIQPDNTLEETMKDAGERYFDILVQKSLFDKFKPYVRPNYYKLHDLLHEMLRAVSTQECCSIVGDDEKLLLRTPKTIRHLFVKDVSPVVLEKVEKFEHLHSFILIYSQRHQDLLDILAKTFKILRSIRLVHINAKELKHIPKEIGDLIHLQYLKIDCHYVLHEQVSLPAFWRLPFLKYLFLQEMPGVKGFDYTYHGNDKVRVFPSLHVLHMNRLPELEDWFVAKATAYECLFPCLTELHLEHCSKLLELPALPPKLEKLNIEDVGWKGSNWLQGISTNYCSIFIRNCQNLDHLRGHQEMDQTTKKCQLILSTLYINDPSLLLKGPLTTVTSIHKLGIIDNDEVIAFSIDDFEEWFLKVSSSLRELIFFSLRSLQCLPSFLESLYSLELLCIINIPLLQLLPNMPASLKELVLIRLPQRQKLPDLPPSLEVIEIRDCNLKFIEDYKWYTRSDWRKIARIHRIEHP